MIFYILLGKNTFEDGDILKTFTQFNIGNLQLKNRIVMPPMCQYSSDNHGMVNDFHRIHYGSRAIGQVGLIIVEATAIVPNGRISNRDLGIWSDDHIDGLKSLVDTIKEYGSAAAIQLAHAGRKSDSGDEYIVAPSPIRHSEKYKEPRELSKEDIKNLVQSFKDAARRAHEAGFDSIEIHAAHGYLIHEFLSPITNKRQDEYGGSLENRIRFLKEILASIKEVWPKDKPILLRVSADDYAPGGINKEEMVKIINQINKDIDLVHVSTGGLVSVKINVFPGYQLPHSEIIKRQCNIPTIAVGLLTSYEESEEILWNDRADLVAFGRELLRNPYLPLNMAYKHNIDIHVPKPYERGFNIVRASV